MLRRSPTSTLFPYTTLFRSSNAANVLKAGRRYGMQSKAFQMDVDGLADVTMPVIVFWNFDHFLVLEGIGSDRVYVNDPAIGRRTLTLDEFDRGFTGIVLTFTPGPEFSRGGTRYTPLRAMRERWPRLGGALPIVVLLGGLIAIVGITTPVFSRIYVDRVLMSGEPAGAVLLAMAVAATLCVVAAAVQQRLLIKSETAIALNGSARFIRHLLRLPMAFFSQRQSADVARRVGTNTQVAELLTRNLATTMVDIVLIAAYGALISYYDVVLGMVAMVFAGLNVVVLRWSAQVRSSAAARLGAERGRLFTTTYNSIQLIETIKAAGDEGRYFRRLASQQAAVLTGQQQSGLPTGALAVLPTLLAALNTALLLLVGTERVAAGALTVGVLVAVQSLVAQLNRPVQELTTIAGRIQDMSADLNRLRDVENYPTPAYGGPVRPPRPVQGHVRVEHLTFGYSPLDEPLLEDFNLEMPPSSRVALVGGSGSGKSTIGRLVSGLSTPWSGQVTIDGAKREEVDADVWASAVALVDQDMVFFRGTVRDNITFWDPTIHDDEVIAALKTACMYDEIAGRPGGLSSMVSEDGRNFSGGQRQRLEIARA